MLDEKAEKTPHVEYRKSQEQFQKMLSNKVAKLSSTEYVPAVQHLLGD
jgi:hypothetical protein